ncbi:sensor histidine kinase, partial [Undibacterium luofuense]|uniref:sensor histidine kinase n=1 Tax=Undibacterium luofuense TaxID=2828733 RepID=UPI002E35BAF5
MSVDSQRFMQIISNLLSNAIKYSPQQETVTISTSLQNDYVRISVTDRGNGIPKEFRSRIFQKFAQADSSDTREKGGTGLGLAITRELVEHMGGQVGFESIPGQGA